MLLSRRDALTSCLTLAALRGAPPDAWTPDWDRAIIQAAVDNLDPSFDEGEAMLKRHIGPEYHYHTNLRNIVAHPTRDSLDYAYLLLEAGGQERKDRAIRILKRLLSLQETEPGSKWHGLWGYYLEEPAPKMSPADWNWADFNGSLLLLIAARHMKALPEALRPKLQEGIRHAANSVRRRNVSMTYTNIAVQGTFVTLAAAEALGDQDLKNYAIDRLHRFARAVDETGSFAEYNSPTYANVTIANLTRIKMHVKDPDALALADRIHRRAWLHLGSHWHAATGQLAGPMSRCYQTDIGAPLWIQKALGGRLAFASLDDLRQRKVRAPGEVGLLDYQCPEESARLFLKRSAPRQHRETFLPAPPPLRPVQGTTWLDRGFSLGSANRCDLWIQRRPLLAYWGSAGQPARYMQLRLVKDDYDFASGLLYAVQEKNYVLGFVNFRSPGGDKHPGLDAVKNGEFQASRLRVQFDLVGVPPGSTILANGKSVTEAFREFPLETALTLELGGARLWLKPRAAAFGERSCRLTLAREKGVLAIAIEFHRSPQPETIRWKDVKTAYAVFTLAMEDAGSGTLVSFDRRCGEGDFQTKPGGTAPQWNWKTPAGTLGLAGNTLVASISAQDLAFRETLNDKPVPLVRLSEQRLG